LESWQSERVFPLLVGREPHQRVLFQECSIDSPEMML